MWLTQTLVLSYAYHCCEFLPLMEGGVEAGAGGESGETEGGERGGLSDAVLVPRQRVDVAAWANATDIWAHYRERADPALVASVVVTRAHRRTDRPRVSLQ